MSQKIIRRVVIHGKVQGVGFRFWAENVARAHGLEGWVRNLRDGAVEALFAGPPKAVAAMVDDCRRGPPSARVARVDEFEAFEAELNLREDGGLFASLPTV